MIKVSLYPKTQRLGKEKNEHHITEKLDGSNLGFFRSRQDVLIIAQRNYIFTLDEALDPANKGIMYRGLGTWLEQYGEVLRESLRIGSGVFGEWISMGRIKYGDALDKKFYIFAKANINNDAKSVYNIYYDPNLFIYPFDNQEIPEFIGVVPTVMVRDEFPTIDELDLLYERYSKDMNRNVEGFIVADNQSVKKYVRMKNGGLEPHITNVGD